MSFCGIVGLEMKRKKNIGDVTAHALGRSVVLLIFPTFSSIVSTRELVFLPKWQLVAAKNHTDVQNNNLMDTSECCYCSFRCFNNLDKLGKNHTRHDIRGYTEMYHIPTTSMYVYCGELSFQSVIWRRYFVPQTRFPFWSFIQKREERSI